MVLIWEIEGLVWFSFVKAFVFGVETCLEYSLAQRISL